MKLPDGREVLVRLAYPLPLLTVAALMRGVGRAAEDAGYTNVMYQFAGADAGAIVGTPGDPDARPRRGRRTR